MQQDGHQGASGGCCDGIFDPSGRYQTRRPRPKRGKETFIITCKDFADAEATTARPPANLKADEEVETFLQACMKLLRNPKAVENLQALIDSCATRSNLTPEVKYGHNL